MTGLGVITPIGNDLQTVSTHLRAGEHGLDRALFWNNPDIPIHVAGTVKGFKVDTIQWRDWRWPERYHIPRETLRGLAPHGVYAFCALAQALDHAALKPEHIAGEEDTGLFCASAGSAMMLHENLTLMHEARGMRGNPLGVVSSIAGTVNFNLAAHFRIRGSASGFASACTSSSHALGYACDAIRLGRLRRALVVGAEDLNGDTLVPFAAMRALSPNDDPRLASRPFDVGRDGFVGGGGAVALILEDADSARARGAVLLAEIEGWGEAADGFSVATSHPEGEGLQLAMLRALADAGIEPGEVDYVSAHATSTPVGDRAEALALRRVFTENGANPLVSSTKALTGHPLSLSGVMEAAFCVVAMNAGFTPGNAHLVRPDPACEGLRLPVEAVEATPRVVLNNSSGFGGSNVCHVLRATDA
ncbi:MAG: beta-ketoacyl-[acyl-carrier-protein] synthase family protein [Opitutaceae bacterium]